MKENPLVSIVIPAYNAEHFILSTLKSVLNQTYRNFEIIVVDDGSKDKTKQLVDKFLNENNLQGQCFKQENKKIAAARNIGILLSKGEFIALLDHDDLWYPEKLIKVMAKFEEYPDIDLICSRENIVRDGKILYQTNLISNSIKDLYSHLLIKGNCLSPSATVFRKHVGGNIGFFREDLELNTVEDYDFWLRFSQIGKIYFLDEILGEYILVDTSASSKIEYHYNNLISLFNDHLFRNKVNFFLSIKLKIIISETYGRLFYKLISSKTKSEYLPEYLMKMFSYFPFSLKNILYLVLGGIFFLRNFCMKLFSDE